MAASAKKCRLDAHKKTRVSQQEFCFKWTVEHFSKFFIKCDEESPTFHSKHYSSKLHLCKEESFVGLEILHRSKRKFSSEEWNTSVVISDSDGNVFYSESVKNVWWGENTTKYQDFPNIELGVLPELNDIVIFTVNVQLLIKENYDVLSEVNRQAEIRNTFIDDVLEVYENKIATDVVLRVESDEIEVHKMILSARSPVFARMFCNPMSETETSVVNIEDIGANAMRELVNFMYCKVELDYDFETAMEVYYAADKYEIRQLRDFCATFLAYRLTVDNVYSLMQSADTHNDRELRRESFKFIKSNFKEVVKTDWWIQLVREKPDLCEEIMDYITH